MNCEDCQIAISDAFDQNNSPLPPEAAEHVKACAECREFGDVFRELDVRLAAQPKPTLPTNFHSKLKARVAEYPRLTPFEIAERRKQYEQEYAQSLALLRHRYFFPPAAVLAQLIVLVLAWGLFGTFLGRLVLALPATLAAANDERLVPLVGWGLTFAICVYGVRYLSRPLLKLVPRASH